MNQNIELEELIIRYISGECSDNESLFVKDLLINDRDALEIYSIYKRIYESSKNFTEEDSFNVDKAVADFDVYIKDSVVLTKKASQRIFSNRFIYFVSGIAASVILILGLFFILNKSEISIIALNKNISDTLPDNSYVCLSQSSSISFKENFNANRIIQIDSGEVFFHVSKNPKKPFVVYANNVSITVIGTKFNINARSKDSIVVTVQEGVVLVENKYINYSEQLTSNQRVIIYEDVTQTPLYQECESVNDLFWQTNHLSFNKTQFSDVARVLKEKLNIEIVIDDHELAKKELTAEFLNQTPQSILEILEVTFCIDIFNENGKYHASTKENCE